jgi:hypothetical protein
MTGPISTAIEAEPEERTPGPFSAGVTLHLPQALGKSEPACASFSYVKHRIKVLKLARYRWRLDHYWKTAFCLGKK